MALDHVNYFIGKTHANEFWGLPLPQYQSIVPFLTRFVTHICAPGFSFIMGISMILFANSRMKAGWSRIKIFRHFAIRGLILIILQLVLENPAWMIGNIKNTVVMSPVPGGGNDVWFFFGVLYSLGGSMIICGLMLYLKPVLLLIISISTIIITMIIIPFLNANILYSPILRLLIIPGQTNSIQVFYSLIPWISFAISGMALGKILLNKKNSLSLLSLLIGLSLILLFIIFKVFNLGSFHNPSGIHWSAFFNITKYPPDILFITLTSGINLCLISLFMRSDNNRIKWINYPFCTFGKNSLFFWIIHLYLFALIGLYINSGDNFSVIYITWVIGLLILLPVCKLYAGFKHKTSPESIWRFF